jgi:hypothetical protein
VEMKEAKPGIVLKEVKPDELKEKGSTEQSSKL